MLLDALLLGGDYVHRKNRNHSTVHCHRHGHLLQWDAVKEDLGVFNAVNGDARHANVAADAGVVTVITAMGCQVKGDAEALLSSLYVFSRVKRFRSIVKTDREREREREREKERERERVSKF